MSSHLTIEDIKNAMVILQSLPPVPIGLEVSPELLKELEKLPSQSTAELTGLAYLQGLPVKVDHDLVGDQFRIKYNKSEENDHD